MTRSEPALLPGLGKEELAVLRYVTERQPTSVREVADHFAATRGDARTTVLTVMERLRQKGYLTRRKSGGVYRYATRLHLSELLKRLVGQFVERMLGGSISPFVAYMAEEGHLSEDELRQLRGLLEKAGRSKPKGLK